MRLTRNADALDGVRRHRGDVHVQHHIAREGVVQHFAQQGADHVLGGAEVGVEAKVG